jgi:NADP-dependent aldehyde dehydrogenase
LVFLQSSSKEDSTHQFLTELRALTAAAQPSSLLTEGIARVFREGVDHRNSLQSTAGVNATHRFSAQTRLFETTGTAFLAEPAFAEELFGPSTLLVLCDSRERLLAAAGALTGQLTASIHGTDADLRSHEDLLHVLEIKAGRIVVNAFPTGVEVGHAQVHGGPWPATSDGRSTSVGTLAILRFTRPVAFQGLPDWALPSELQNANPLNIRRLRDGLPEAPQP